jgi:hypothetical protein
MTGDDLRELCNVVRTIFDRILQRYRVEDVDSNFLRYNPMASLCEHGN